MDSKLIRTPISPKRVRYIKLGEGGRWEEECLATGQLRMGFASGSPEIHASAVAGDWAAVHESWIESGKDQATATRFTGETKYLFEDDGETLWITFVRQRLCWGFVDTGTPCTPHPDADDSTVRPVVGGWRWHDLAGAPLTKAGLAGRLTQLAAYRGTSCSVSVADYVVNRINGRRSPEVERAMKADEVMAAATLDLIRMLDPGDFELLVDLIFSTSGWRRLGEVGRTQKTIDLDLLLPTTGERAFVQVKSRTTSAELAEYLSSLEPDGPHTRLFYAYHSGDAVTVDARVTILGPERIARMTLDAGLFSWLVAKVS